METNSHMVVIPLHLLEKNDQKQYILTINFYFYSFFGGFGFHFEGSQHSHQREVPRGSDIQMDLEVTLEELFNGNFIEVIFQSSSFNF